MHLKTKLPFITVALFLGAQILTGSQAQKTSPEEGDETVHVLTYNIHAGKDAQGQLSIRAIAALVDSLRPDVVLLQEVDRRTTRAKGEDHLAQLAELTHMHAAFGKSLDFQGGDYGIALLSRWPIDSATTVPLDVQPPEERSGGSHEPRVALHAVLRAPHGRLDVITTHIDAAGTSTYRKQEVVDLLAHLQRSVAAGAPVILGGDLNSRPVTDEIAALSLSFTDAWASCGEGPGETFPAANPDRRIDYIFFRHARCLHARVPAAQASDHRPLLVTLQILRRP